MKLLTGTKKKSSPDVTSRQRMAELEARQEQLSQQLLVAQASLAQEMAERQRVEEKLGSLLAMGPNAPAEEEELPHSTEQLRELSARLQSVREEERTRLARAIHDELGQTLTGLKMDVAWLQRHLDQAQPALLEKTRAMSDLIDTTVQVVRRLATELRPGILDLGLVATVEWQLQEFQSRTGIEGVLINAPEEITLDGDGATTVFRIFQEILTNVVRHARATRVEVTLAETPKFLRLRVQDNGRGITDAEIHSPKSIGLLGMQERARLQEGSVHFQGIPGQGTSVTIRVPLAVNNKP